MDPINLDAIESACRGFPRDHYAWKLIRAVRERDTEIARLCDEMKGMLRVVRKERVPFVVEQEPDDAPPGAPLSEIPGHVLNDCGPVEYDRSASPGADVMERAEKFVAKLKPYVANTPIFTEHLARVLQQYGDERAAAAKVALVLAGWGPPLGAGRAAQEERDAIIAAAAREAAIEEAALWHYMQASAWQDQAVTAYRQAQHGDEAEALEYRAQHETYTKHRIIHQKSSSYFRALVAKPRIQEG